eukprot:COSAG02_NODE_274_length_26244_cov_36.943507_3_plen_79_part_00
MMHVSRTSCLVQPRCSRLATSFRYTTLAQMLAGSSSVCIHKSAKHSQVNTSQANTRAEKSLEEAVVSSRNCSRSDGCN